MPVDRALLIAVALTGVIHGHAHLLTVMSSQSPSSTSGSVPTTTSASGNSDSFFGGPASPPVILVILAIVMFGVAIMAILGWRRTHSGGALALSPFGLELLGFDREIERKEGKAIGEKPALWDVWYDQASHNLEASNKSFADVMVRCFVSFPLHMIILTYLYLAHRSLRCRSY